MATVKDLMTKRVLSVRPETPLVEVTNILTQNNLNGLPVVDQNNVLVGIITDYDLILKGTSVHLPTFIKLMSEIDLYKKDRASVKDDLKKILNIKVADIMNREPLVLTENSSMEEAFNAFTEHHTVNPIPVINSERKIVGIISRYDMNKIFGSSGQFITDTKEREIDKSVNTFLKDFEDNFIFISKNRTNLWLITNLISAIVGYIVAWILIIHIG